MGAVPLTPMSVEMIAMLSLSHVMEIVQHLATFYVTGNVGQTLHIMNVLLMNYHIAWEM